MEDDQVNLMGLEHLIMSLKGKLPAIKIGILAGGSRQPKKGKTSHATNATIGAVHEYGSPARGIPARSFLRMPMTEHLQKEIEASGILDKNSADDVVKKGSLKPLVEKMAILAEAVVQDAFETGGFGTWPQWKDPNYTNEGGMLLVDTQQLRNSITTRVD